MQISLKGEKNEKNNIHPIIVRFDVVRNPRELR
mgnify:CR=1 FL=1